MSCEGNIIETVTRKGVEIILEAWHPTRPGDRKDDCSFCVEGSEEYGWYGLSLVEEGVVVELVPDPISARPTTQEIEKLADLVAASDPEVPSPADAVLDEAIRALYQKGE